MSADKKIEKLTPEQESRLSEFRDKWLSIGLSTEPTDKEKAQKAICEAYESAGLAAPKAFIWMRSPYEGAIAASILAESSNDGKLPWSKVLSKLKSLVKKK